MDSVYSSQDEKPEFWFNLKTLRVEVGKKSPAPYRVGPFDTEAEARSALETIRKRSAQWSREDSDD